MNEPTKERAAAMARITTFLDAREKMRGNDPDLIGSINSKFNLTVSDLRALLAAPVSEKAADKTTLTHAQLATLYVALGHFKASGSSKCAESMLSIIKMHRGEE